MTPAIKIRIEIVVAGLSALAFLATMFWPTWFELLFESDPDGGDGTLERVVVLTLTGATAIVMTVLSGRNVARTRRAAGATS